MIKGRTRIIFNIFPPDIGTYFSFIMADRTCCVPGCTKSRENDIVLHKFPNPEKDLIRFSTWVQAVGGNLLCLDDIYVYKYRRVCHIHFEPRYWTRSKMLSNIAIPTLHMKGDVAEPLAEVTHKNNTLEITEVSIKQEPKDEDLKSTCTQETATALTSNYKQVPATALTSNLEVVKSEKAQMCMTLKKESLNIAIEGKNDEPGGPTTLPVDEVRLLKKRGKITGRGKKVGDRKRNTREGTSQREARSDAEEVVRDQPRVRDGETRCEKGPDMTESAGGASRPPHTSTDVSRDDPRPRHHRGGRGESLHTTTLPGTSMPQPGPSSTGPVKRERPNDSASPSTLQGDAKRVRVHSAEGEPRTSAWATKDIPAWLAVAICFPPPSRDLTKEEADQVKVGLEDLLMGTESTTPLPAFRGFPRIAEGTVQMWCEDDYALAWLTHNVPLLKLPNTNLTLTVLRQSDVPTRVKASLFVPGYRGDVERLHSILTRQNTWYDMARWSLHMATTVGGDNYGTYLTLGVPLEEVEKVLGRERRISYLLGSIYVRFWPNDPAL